MTFLQSRLKHTAVFIYLVIFCAFQPSPMLFANYPNAQDILTSAFASRGGVPPSLSYRDTTDISIVSTIYLPGFIDNIVVLDDTVCLVTTRRLQASPKDPFAYDILLLFGTHSYSYLPECSGKGALQRYNIDANNHCAYITVGYESECPVYKITWLNGTSIKGPISIPQGRLGSAIHANTMYPLTIVNNNYRVYSPDLDLLPSLFPFSINNAVIMESFQHGLLLAPLSHTNTLDDLMLVDPVTCQEL